MSELEQTFPDQPSGSGSPKMTCNRSLAPADSAASSEACTVPSSLRSSTSATRNGPGYSWPKTVGSVLGSISASLRAGTMATAEQPLSPSLVAGRSSRGETRQNKPRPARSQIHATRDAAATPHQANTMASPPFSHTLLVARPDQCSRIARPAVHRPSRSRAHGLVSCRSPLTPARNRAQWDRGEGTCHVLEQRR